MPWVGLPTFDGRVHTVHVRFANAGWTGAHSHRGSTNRHCGPANIDLNGPFHRIVVPMTTPMPAALTIAAPSDEGAVRNVFEDLQSIEDPISLGSEVFLRRSSGLAGAYRSASLVDRSSALA
jgi:hypothetical protein